MEALSLKRLKLVVLDIQRDAKAFSLFTLPQVRLDAKTFILTCFFKGSFPTYTGKRKKYDWDHRYS